MKGRRIDTQLPFSIGEGRGECLFNLYEKMTKKE